MPSRWSTIEASAYQERTELFLKEDCKFSIVEELSKASISSPSVTGTDGNSFRVDILGRQIHYRFQLHGYRKLAFITDLRGGPMTLSGQHILGGLIDFR